MRKFIFSILLYCQTCFQHAKKAPPALASGTNKLQINNNII